MLVGIAIFVGGMIALLLITRYLNGGQTISAIKPIERQTFSSIESVKPIDNVPVFKPVAEDMNVHMPQIKVFNRDENITSAIKMIDGRYEGDGQSALNWTSFDLSNNGPNPVYFGVNEWDWSEAPLPVGQTINIDLKNRGAIKKVFLKCDMGETANVSLYVVK